MLPGAILIALAEAFKVRSLLAHLVAGVAIMVVGYYASGLAPPSYEESIDHPPPPISRAAEIAAAAGAVFGLRLLADRRPQCRALARAAAALRPERRDSAAQCQRRFQPVVAPEQFAVGR